MWQKVFPLVLFLFAITFGNMDKNDSIIIEKLLRINNITKFTYPFSFVQVNSVGKVTKITLHDENVRVLPDEIGDLTDLEHLFFHKNEIARLPGSISKLKKLQYLNLEENKLKTLPNELESCLNIGYLHIGSNGMVDFPKCITKLTKIVQLHVYNNNFKTLPEEIVNLKPTLRANFNKNNLKKENLSQAVIAWLNKYSPNWSEKQPINFINNKISGKSFIDGEKFYYVHYKNGNLKLHLFDLLGKKNTIIFSGYKNRGIYNFNLKNKLHTSKLYIVRINREGLKDEYLKIP